MALGTCSYTFKSESVNIKSVIFSIVLRNSYGYENDTFKNAILDSLKIESARASIQALM